MHLVRATLLGAAMGILGALLVAAPAHAQNCPGNPNALGTSRVLVVGPAEYTRVGTMQYPETLPLADKEVVLTFDDGPLPRYSNKILDILTSECVKATFFIVGRMAREFPDVVRREYAAGYTIGAHSQNHPLRFQKLSGDNLHREIDDGIASVSAALGDPKELAPFFRIPGLCRTDEIDQELAARSLVTFSADVVADDWYHRITPARIIKRAMSRLEKRGKGSILLLHDIHAATVAALPGLLKELKDHGYHIVQVAPPAPAEPETVGEPKAFDSDPAIGASGNVVPIPIRKN
jgi:peptidoglycan-N-acetylglucosamine deacetylase